MFNRSSMGRKNSVNTEKTAAATTEPVMLPAPPTTTITTIVKASTREKDLGVMAVTRWAHSPPATPAKKAPITSAATRVRNRFTPQHSAAKSSSRTDSMVLPKDENLIFQLTKRVTTTQGKTHHKFVRAGRPLRPSGP